MLICKGCYDTFSDDTNRNKCCCGGELTDARKCKVCGQWCAYDDMNDEICDDCLNEYMTVRNAIDAGKEPEARERIEINGFIASCFTNEEIDAILEKALEQLIDSSDVNSEKIISKAEEWLSEDKYWFAYWVIEKLKEGRI